MQNLYINSLVKKIILAPKIKFYPCTQNNNYLIFTNCYTKSYVMSFVIFIILNFHANLKLRKCVKNFKIKKKYMIQTKMETQKIQQKYSNEDVA